MVATIDDMVVGHILVFKNRRKFARVFSICTSKNYRGKGVAKKLLNQAILYFRDIEYQSIFLEVRVDNHLAQNIYKKFGFEIIKTISSFYKDGCDAYKMRVVL